MYSSGIFLYLIYLCYCVSVYAFVEFPLLSVCQTLCISCYLVTLLCYIKHNRARSIFNSRPKFHKMFMEMSEMSKLKTHSDSLIQM